MRAFFKYALPAVLFFTLSPQTAPAQTVSPQVMNHAVTIAKACPQHWATPACLKAVSDSNMDLAVNYADTLDKAGKKQALETLKQGCAASTAASEGEYPAYAMQSAYTECVNTIYDISSQTGLTPDASHYQLLVGAVLCLSEDPGCAGLEQQMQAYAR